MGTFHLWGKKWHLPREKYTPLHSRVHFVIEHVLVVGGVASGQWFSHLMNVMASVSHREETVSERILYDTISGIE